MEQICNDKCEPPNIPFLPGPGPEGHPLKKCPAAVPSVPLGGSWVVGTQSLPVLFSPTFCASVILLKQMFSVGVCFGFSVWFVKSLLEEGSV